MLPTTRRRASSELWRIPPKRLYIAVQRQITQTRLLSLCNEVTWETRRTKKSIFETYSRKTLSKATRR